MRLSTIFPLTPPPLLGMILFLGVEEKEGHVIVYGGWWSIVISLYWEYTVGSVLLCFDGFPCDLLVFCPDCCGLRVLFM